MPPAAQWMKHPLGRPAVWLAVAGLYCLLGVAALNWAVIQENTAVLWPATGLAVAAVIRFGYGVWPGLALGAAAVVLTTSAPPAAALAIGLGNTLEALAGVWLFRRLAGPGEPLSDVRRALLFIVAAVLAGPLLSAGFGAFALNRFLDLPVTALPWVALTWWLGNVAGALLVAPVLLAWTSPAWHLQAVRPLEWTALLLATLAVCVVAFGWVGLPNAHYPLSFLPFPVVLWAGLRFCQRGGTLVSLLVAAAAVVSTTLGRGPFVIHPFEEGYWLLLAYLVVGGGTLLLMAVVIRQWLEQHQALESSRAELEARVGERTRELSEANAALAESERRLRLVVSEAPVILWSIDPEACFTFVQGRGLDVLGVRAEDVLGREPADVFPGNPRIAENCERLLRGEAIQTYLSLDDRVFELHAVPLRHDDQRISGAIGVCLDVTERARAEEKLRLNATVFANTTEGVMITDSAGHILAVNAAFSEITGYAEEEALGRNPRMLRSDRHDPAFYEGMWQAIAEQGRWQGEIWNRRKNGEVYPQWLSISAVRDGAGEVSHYVAVFSDISSLKISQRQLDFLAYHDPLTGLANRLLFNERLAHAIQRAEREQQGLAVLFLDLDHFKHVNDSLGHPVGDELMVQLARRLVEAMRGEDTVARLGGDEFVVLAEGIDSPEDVATIANKMLDTCRHPFPLVGREIYVGGSIGVSLYPGDGADADHLIKNADAALYLAKGDGRNTFRFYTTELTRRALERVELEAELRRALEAEEFELHYQPQVCLKTGNILAVEALLRWRHPQRGLLAPDAFLRVAEESGLIVPIGAWVLRQACHQMTAWLDDGYALEHIAVNLSGIQVEREGLREALGEALQGCGLSPYFIELEITEGALALERAEVLLRELKELGLRISVDDFGTGFSSLGYLKRLPLDGLKIDRSFVMGCEHDEANTAIVESILALGKGLGISVVAEGVETEAEMDWLKRLGCEAAQGYYFFRPLPAEEVARHFVLNQPGSCG